MKSLRCKIILLLGLVVPTIVGQMNEDDRHQAYLDRGYEWPLPEVVPNTTGWDRLMRRRLAQVERVEDIHGRYNGFISGMTQALVAPNFTENGWGLTRAPADLVALLRTHLSKGILDSNNVAEEYEMDVIEGASGEKNWQRPLFIRQRTLNKLILEELKPMHEEWVGIPLIGQVAYGLRVYRNQSVLHMHTDRMRTHIISCILHVDHDQDSEPWPLFIEDFQGNTNEVVLESGDMLFYESSKCIHGRPRPFHGSWYSSIFVHYYPANDWNPENRDMEADYAVPKHWQGIHLNPVDNDPKDLDRLKIIGTSYTEPDCPDEWCKSLNTVKWFGPAKEGVVMTTGFKDDTKERDEL